MQGTTAYERAKLVARALRDCRRPRLARRQIRLSTASIAARGSAAAVTARPARCTARPPRPLRAASPPASGRASSPPPAECRGPAAPAGRRTASRIAPPRARAHDPCAPQPRATLGQPQHLVARRSSARSSPGACQRRVVERRQHRDRRASRTPVPAALDRRLEHRAAARRVHRQQPRAERRGRLAPRRAPCSGCRGA